MEIHIDIYIWPHISFKQRTLTIIIRIAIKLCSLWTCNHENHHNFIQYVYYQIHLSISNIHYFDNMKFFCSYIFQELFMGKS